MKETKMLKLVNIGNSFVQIPENLIDAKNSILQWVAYES